ncbi:MAG: SpvB/TcaC N-terminal domain-containing protein [Polyangiales bacterium]
MSSARRLPSLGMGSDRTAHRRASIAPTWLRLTKAPIAFATLIAFVAATTLGSGSAQADGGSKPVEVTVKGGPVLIDPGLLESVVGQSSDKTATPIGAGGKETITVDPNAAVRNDGLASLLGTTPAVPATPAPETLTLGGDKSGVSSQAITTPAGSGKVQGWGESFSAQLSTGVGSFSVPLSLPDARGGIDPSLGLTYSSSGSHGVAGVGWEIGVPFIARQTDRGAPTYNDPSPGTAWLPGQDRFIFNGGQELVPICLVSGTSCTGAPTETMPSWGSGWWYFRARVEGSFLRFFWSQDHTTWRVQDKTGWRPRARSPDGGSDRRQCARI